ncbi:N-acetylmuramoyl-L-alanine amidase [Granulicella sp. dw_53]|uniref:N-acetylmuramoyl-L-alanine amidase n=1 Tax=Granulicella sp. dw_53 TaxID=2719792 RepID=UPI001BD1BD3C|nr:N-acetylmuramoyl-L-alanine amidase [Granulicella sp. dw_53]
MALCKKVRIGWWRGVGCAAVVGCCVVAWSSAQAASKVGTSSRTTKSLNRRVASTPWELAERGRDTLEAIPEGNRIKANYTTALNGFRAVYHDHPQDVHAPNAVFAVAELLAEQGRDLRDTKSLKAAVGQYEFLRMQYPGSSLRVAALLAQGQIYANDLSDEASARERYSLLLKQFPKSEHAEEARAGLEALSAGSRAQSAGLRAQVPASREQAVARGDASGVRPLVSLPATAATRGSNGPNGTNGIGTAASAAAPSDTADRSGTARPVDEDLDRQSAPAQSAVPVAGPAVAKTVVKRSGKLALVSGIRHWSTPTYTRVAIDLGDDVTFEAARVPNPDRIYFDLHGTQLARELVGKSFGVTDDGFLKKIRAAQFSNDMTRVVLDVNDVTEYSAFLLPNPYRLIIDIHGGAKTTQAAAAPDSIAATAPSGESVLQAPVPTQVPAPRTAPVVKPTQARPVPNTIFTRSSSATEIAALSAQPGKVEATSVPTSQPIAAVVEKPGSGSRAQGPDGQIVGDGTASAGNQGVSGLVGTGDTASSVAVPSASSLTKKVRKGKAARADDSVPARAAVPTADGQTSLVRALGLKIGRIVIDPGHGGHDSGTLGVDGIEEKDVVLDVALRLGKALHDRLGAEIIYTRSDDTFIPLETRTAIANKAQADLFLSIHANSSSDPSARGVETYYLNFTSSPDALETAARENAVSDQSIHQLSDLVKKIALKDKISESREFAGDVEESLYGGLQRGNAGLKDRGVKKAPFVVLIGANMPSILAEISFVTNPKDASQLQQPDYRQRVAESLYKGVAKYAGGLSGVRSPTERASAK